MIDRQAVVPAPKTRSMVYNGILIELVEEHAYDGDTFGKNRIVRAEMTRDGRKVACLLPPSMFGDGPVVEAHINHLYAELVKREHTAGDAA